MAWTNSKLFRAFGDDMLRNAVAFDFDTDVPKVALYNNTITPDNDVASANTAYAVGQWVVGGETSEAGEWPAGGRPLVSAVLNASPTGGTADVWFYDAADTTSVGSTADITNATGCLVYDDTITTPTADQGICYNYFGGPNSVVNGQFTVVWNANGIWRITL